MDARKFARSIEIRTSREWYQLDLPYDIPVGPKSVYKDDWVSWIDWLGNENREPKPKKKWRPFKDARQYIRSLGFKSYREWYDYDKSKLPDDIRCEPTAYDEWISYPDWLGYDKKRKRDFVSARKYVRSLGLKTKREWDAYKPNLPEDIPLAPNRAYKDDWVSWIDWLGNEDRYLSFEDAREYVRSLGFESCKDYKKYCESGEKPDNIPASPTTTRTYKKNWISWGDWLGTGISHEWRRKEHKWRPFDDAREFVRPLNLKTGADWREWITINDLPSDIRRDPTLYDEWISWGDWLGTGRSWSKNKRQTKVLATIYEQLQGTNSGTNSGEIVLNDILAMLDLTKLRGSARSRYLQLVKSGGGGIKLGKLKNSNLQMYMDLVYKVVEEFYDELIDNWRLIIEDGYLRRVGV